MRIFLVLMIVSYHAHKVILLMQRSIKKSSTCSIEAGLFTLAHEMAHVWQKTHGTPPRRFYHDRQWAAKMNHRRISASRCIT
jgi:Zn-dependent peptidase ImmA (M78 family)